MTVPHDADRRESAKDVAREVLIEGALIALWRMGDQRSRFFSEGPPILRDLLARVREEDQRGYREAIGALKDCHKAELEDARQLTRMMSEEKDDVIAKLEAARKEHEERIDRMDKHTEMLMSELEAAIRERDEAQRVRREQQKQIRGLERTLEGLERTLVATRESYQRAFYENLAFREAETASKERERVLREALARIAAETDGIPEMNCEIAHGIATEALAAGSPSGAEGEKKS